MTSNRNSLLTSGLVILSAFIGLNIISSSVRKFTFPIFKYSMKQQLKFIAGMGILYIATYISNINIEPEDIIS